MGIIAPLIAGAAAVGSSLINRNQAKKQWKREIDYNEKFWKMQNQYNAPQAQMKRLQEAGLNPNLVYGGSSGGTAGQAEMLRTPDMDPSGNRIVESEGITSMLGGFNDFNVKQAQTDNLKSQTQVNQETALLKATQTYGEGIKNARTSLDLKLAEDLYHTSAEAAKQQLEKLKADTQYTRAENYRRGTITERNVAESIEKVLASQQGRKLSEAQIKKIRTDTRVQEAAAKLADMNLPANSPAYMQLISNLVKMLFLKK